jgi:hypothetical protein
VTLSDGVPLSHLSKHFHLFVVTAVFQKFAVSSNQNTGHVCCRRDPEHACVVVLCDFNI